MKTRRLTRAALCFLLSLPLAVAQNGSPTPLDDYVRAADDSFRYELVHSIPGEGWKADVLGMASQTWGRPDEVDRTLWKHWVVVYRPEKVAHSTALLFLGGGSNADAPPAKADGNWAEIAVLTQSIVAELRMVPNQPLSYKDDPFGPRKEDQLIAYHWRRFLDEGDPNRLTRLPMTKSAVRAMDAVSSFASEQGIDVRNYFVAGGSKRGWTTWTTAAVDERVIAIAPIVIDLLNLRKSFIHHYRVYGFWAPAVGDYYREGIMDRLGDPAFDELTRIVAPYSYRERYDMPKFILNSAGDQFFLPDSSRFYFDDLPGEKHLRYTPNSDHSLRKTDALGSLTAFYHAVLTGRKRPAYSWKFAPDGSIQVRSDDQPAAVKLWTAHNPKHRDFRLESVGPIYRARDLAAESEGVWSARVEKPDEGFTAFFVELTFPSGVKYPFKFTTGVRVTPDVYPNGPPEKGKTKLGPKRQ